MAGKPQPRSKRPQRAAKQGAHYREPSTDIDVAEDDDAELDPYYTSTQVRRPSTRTRKRARSIESPSRTRKRLRLIVSAPKDDWDISSISSDSEDSSDDNESHSSFNTRPRVTLRLTASSSHKSVKSGTAIIRIPWNSLPYHILCQIFDFASFPLYDERLQPYNDSIKWLLDTSLVCRDFTEPCLTALYRCPPLAPMSRAHQLVKHLRADQNAMCMNYRNKIESIRFEVSATAMYSYAGQGSLNLYGLICNSVRLKDLEIYHEKDRFKSTYKDLEGAIKWSYPDEIFRALEERWTEEVDELDRATQKRITVRREHGPIKLRSWRWSSRLAGEKQKLENLLGIHLTPSFNDLRKIAFVNYSKPKLTRKEQVDPDHEAKLAEAIGVLPNLQHLIFESCTLVNSKLLPLLPSSLQILEVINCAELTADDMTAFLVSKGGHLRELILNHNQSLSLSFLPVLASSCPQLEVLRMNLVYYNQHSAIQDSNPKYENLLSVEEVPTWPSSLRIIDLHHLRNWDIETAEMFFQSFIDSAAQLPNLRELTINANLTLGWKIRAEFRDKWVNTMNKVFLFTRRRAHVYRTLEEIDADTEEQTTEADEVDEDADEPNEDDEDDEDGEKDIIMLRFRPRNTRSTGLVGPKHVRKSTRLHPAPRKLGSQDDPDPLLERGKRSTRSRKTYVEPESSDESEDELARPTPPEKPMGSRRTRRNDNLASPPNSSYSSTQSEGDQPSSRAATQTKRMNRELAILYATAPPYKMPEELPLPSSPPNSGIESDDEPLCSKRERKKGKGKAKHVEPFVQGMCHLVDISIDNLRPRDELMTEMDFLDAEPEDDSDWDGDDLVFD